MLIVREEYKGKKISGSKFELDIDDIPESSYQYWYDNGLDYIFKEFKPKSVNYKGSKKKIKLDDFDSERRN